MQYLINKESRPCFFDWIVKWGTEADFNASSYYRQSENKDEWFQLLFLSWPHYKGERSLKSLHL